MTNLPPRPARPSIGGNSGLPGRPARPQPANPIFARPTPAPQPPVVPVYEEPEAPVTPEPEEEYFEEPAQPYQAEEEVYEEEEDLHLEPEAEQPGNDLYEVAYEDQTEEPAPAPTYAPVPTPAEYAAEVEEELTAEDVELRDTIASFSPEVREAAQKLLALIVDDSSTEVLLNAPDKILFKQQGQRYLANISFPDVETYHKVINAVILSVTHTTDRLGTTQNLIEGQLEIPDPEGGDEPLMRARVHIMAPPTVTSAKVTIAKKPPQSYRLDDLLRSGSMNSGMAEFLKALARGRATVVIAGGTGSGKTTLLEAISHEFDENDRVAVIEDTPELRIPLTDVVPMVSTTQKPGLDKDNMVTLDFLVQQANRMRMDRIIVGEIRGGEMAEFLNAANSGVEGSMTTVHADTPRDTINKIVRLSMKNESVRDADSVYRDIASTVHVIVQCGLIDNRDHRITEISEVSDTRSATSGLPQMSPLFEYRLDSGTHVSPGQPSGKLRAFLQNRGVHYDPNWFAPRAK